MGRPRAMTAIFNIDFSSGSQRLTKIEIVKNKSSVESKLADLTVFYDLMLWSKYLLKAATVKGGKCRVWSQSPTFLLLII